MSKEPKFEVGDLVINSNRPLPEEIYEVVRQIHVYDDPFYDLKSLSNGQEIALTSEHILRAVKAAEIAEFRKKYPNKLR